MMRSHKIWFTILLMSSAFSLPASSAVKKGSPAPDFSIKKAGSEETVTLSDFKDKKIVIVHFWKSR
ncbi:hypothetical protein BVY01_05020 [bacterium I07]|nr:hypothetical protein BVY01_05020 [bacterium I07]